MSAHKITVFKNEQATRVELGVDQNSGQFYMNVTRLRTAPGEIANLYNSELEPKNDQLWLDFLKSRLEQLDVEVPEEMFLSVYADNANKSLGYWKDHSGYTKEWTTLEYCVPDAKCRMLGNFGDYNEDIGRFRNSQGLEEGHWYLDPLDLNALYIVPNEAYGGAEIEGPDTPMLETLEAEYREHDFERINPVQMAAGLGLVFVEKERRGFSELRGHYVIS